MASQRQIRRGSLLRTTVVGAAYGSNRSSKDASKAESMFVPESPKNPAFLEGIKLKKSSAARQYVDFKGKTALLEGKKLKIFACGALKF